MCFEIDLAKRVSGRRSVWRCGICRNAGEVVTRKQEVEVNEAYDVTEI